MMLRTLFVAMAALCVLSSNAHARRSGEPNAAEYSIWRQAVVHQPGPAAQQPRRRHHRHRHRHRVNRTLPAAIAVPLPIPRPVVPVIAPAPAVPLAALVEASLRTLTPITDELVAKVGAATAAITREIQIAAAREYLAITATPGGTMSRDGVRNNIAKLHPEFVLRLAAAIREARANGLPRAGLYSAYRAPGWGVGGFKDKFNSFHAVGMAGDLAGIGRAGSAESRSWYAIASRHLIFNPYGPAHRAEWNHYQITLATKVEPQSPLRGTITAKGPISLERMWTIAQGLIRDAPYYGKAIIRSHRRHMRMASR